jgi:hypothetical protein
MICSFFTAHIPEIGLPEYQAESGIGLYDGFIEKLISLFLRHNSTKQHQSHVIQVMYCLYLPFAVVDSCCAETIHCVRRRNDISVGTC